MAIPPLDGGRLPMGRYRCSESDIEQAFVCAAHYRASTTRAAIWQDWRKGVSLLSGAALIHRAWISGSFVTDKIDPQDIDAVFVISAEDLATRSDDDLRVVESFTSPIRNSTGALVRRHGLRVDSYTLRWAPHNGNPNLGDYNAYVANRGYWDDFWSRTRVTMPKTAAPQRVDALPVHGYLEVEFNAFA